MNAAIQLGIIVETSSTLRVRNYINKEFEVGSNRLIGKDPRLILTTNDLVSARYANNTGTGVLRALSLDKYFDFPKPISLIDTLLKLATDSDSIVLDFFSGSGTTAHAVMQLNAEDGGNRKHIQVQLPEPTDEKSEAYKAGYKKISDIARERIHRAGEKIKADYADKLAERDTPLDVGYRTYKLADTNFTKWQTEFAGDVDELQARLNLMRDSSNDNASELDLLTEILLKMGIELTTPVEQVDIAGLTWHRVGGVKLIYLNERVKPTLDQLRAAADTDPAQIVVLEDAFQSDDQLKTNLAQICKTNNVELWTV